MQNIQQIIVPVDFHKHTEGLVDFAIDIANKLGGKITFLHVAQSVMESTDYFDVYPESLAIANDELYAQAQKQMQTLLRKKESSSPGCTGEVLKGDVVESIIDYIKYRKGDMIIIGTHGYKGIQKIMMGSVANRVLRRASCPILVFNPYKGERG